MIIPITSLLTVGVVYYITMIYYTVYIPSLNELGETSDANFHSIVFAFFPVLIYWVLIQIICSDPGHVTPKLIDKILNKNGL